MPVDSRYPSLKRYNLGIHLPTDGESVGVTLAHGDFARGQRSEFVNVAVPLGGFGLVEKARG